MHAQNDLIEDRSPSQLIGDAVRAVFSPRSAVRSAADDVASMIDLAPHAASVEPGMLAARVSLSGLTLIRARQSSRLSA